MSRSGHAKRAAVGSSGRVAVGVSGRGSNLRALSAASARGELGGTIVLVFADRPCPALDWAHQRGIDTVLVPAAPAHDGDARSAEDRALAGVLQDAKIELVVLAGYMRLVGPLTLAAFPNRILNIHPSLLPGFPGAHAVRDALAHGAAVTGATVHIVDGALDAGPIVAQQAVPILPDDDETLLHARIQGVEHWLLPRAVALVLAGAVGVKPIGRQVTIDLERAEQALPVPRRALLSVSDKTGLVALASSLVALGFELVSTGGTARTLRSADLPVTDVGALTGFPEMLDGRVKTLHPRIHAGILADRRVDEHRRQLVAAAIAPFELVVVNLYPFAAAIERPGIGLDELIEEIDIGGPALARAAAKNHASVAIVTAPGRYPAVLEALTNQGSVPPDLRAALAIEAFRHTAAYDARIAWELPARMAAAGIALPDEPGLPGSSDPYPPVLMLALEKVETLRYGENPHQPAARYRRPGATLADGPFAVGETPLQGKALSYNNVLDGSAAATLARALRGPGCVIVKHTNPCGAAERESLIEAWGAALAGDPVSAFGGVVALTGEVDGALAETLCSIFLEVVVAPGFDADARRVFAGKSNLRLIVDPVLGKATNSATSTPSARTHPTSRASQPALVPASAPADPTGAIRTAGGAVLVTAPDTAPDDPAGWNVATNRPPTVAEARDLDLAWRLVRGVTSNAIVIVKDGRLVGLGSGQTSRVDAARLAVDRARAITGPDATLGAACASDAFYPFPDAVEVCLAAGVTAFAQPGGSVRDAEVIAAADAVGATMLLTGVRHFRH